MNSPGQSTPGQGGTVPDPFDRTEVAGQTNLADQKTQLIAPPKPQKRLNGFTLLLMGLALVVGIALGAGGVLSYFLSISGDRQVQPPPAAAATGNSGAIVV